MSESRKYRKFTAQQKLEIVLAGLRGDRTVREVCREHHVSETQYYGQLKALPGSIVMTNDVASTAPLYAQIQEDHLQSKTERNDPPG